MAVSTMAEGALQNASPRTAPPKAAQAQALRLPWGWEALVNARAKAVISSAVGREV